ncbi:hypothetical protein EX895_003217 [Sporisorium graminicola]|uniref:Uncharacterized protein n=1 Tax=Sporisorium graminicola TaxID=280036 RepID=A0A4U7KU37_9BASI|nr:hypothetical protein EX895_003217 [Sporisorium graminicola]TKY87636.1 hypothetical protein EX895_003217 [Sporisorium graminicola]
MPSSPRTPGARRAPTMHLRTVLSTSPSGFNLLPTLRITSLLVLMILLLTTLPITTSAPVPEPEPGTIDLLRLLSARASGANTVESLARTEAEQAARHLPVRTYRDAEVYVDNAVNHAINDAARQQQLRDRLGGVGSRRARVVLANNDVAPRLWTGAGIDGRPGTQAPPNTPEHKNR